MTGTGLLQVGYFLFLQAGYRLGDLSLVYPLGRGSGALLAALAGITLLGERPGPAGITGIVLVVLGVLVLGATRPGRPPPQPARRAPAGPAALPGDRLRAGDGDVHRVLHALGQVRGEHAPGAAAPPGLRLAAGDGPGPGALALRQRDRTTRVWRRYRRQVTGAAVLSPLAYILVLIAMSFTAVSAVAPAREVSVLAGVLLGRRLLGEGSLARRLTAAGAIAAGIICIAVG